MMLDASRAGILDMACVDHGVDLQQQSL